MNPNTDYYLMKADYALRALTLRTFNHSCAMKSADCQGELDVHHIITRGHKSLRHEPMNAILLCRYHHQQAPQAPHFSPVQFDKWLYENRVHQWEWCMANKNRILRPNYAEAAARLKKILEAT